MHFEEYVKHLTGFVTSLFYLVKFLKVYQNFLIYDVHY